jgi:aryl-alcohol dehydrogenase-like predicted oxidoreductase
MTPKPSRLGMGTYLGALTPEFSEKVKMTLAKGIQELGLTTIDTAINYRCMRSEQLIGDLIQTKKINRDRIYLTTKGGFIPFDQNIPENSTPYIHNKITTPLNLEPADIIEGCHCIHPTYICLMLLF